MQTIKASEDTMLFKKGDAADCMYKVLSGKVIISDASGEGSEKVIASVGKGDFFGEMGVIEKLPRSADAMLVEGSEVEKIDIDDFIDFVKTDRASALRIMKTLSENLLKTDEKLMDAVRLITKYTNNDYLKNSSSKLKFEKIKNRFKRAADARGLSKRLDANNEAKTHAEKGCVLFSEGDAGKHLFVIEEGEVSFYVNYRGSLQMKIGTSKAGDIFGEMAVLSDQKRTATAVAETDVKLKPVNEDSLVDFISENPEAVMTILRNLSGRIRSTTESYVEVLKSVSEFVKETSEDVGQSYDSWTDMMQYATEYDLFLRTTTSPFLFDIRYH